MTYIFIYFSGDLAGSSDIFQCMGNQVPKKKSVKKDSKAEKEIKLTPSQLQKRIFKSLDQTNKLSMLERYAIFMGKAQLIELTLKNLLVQFYKVPEENLEKATLGRAISMLEQKKFRGDFVSLLWQLNEYRVEMAHEFLSSFAILNKLSDGKFSRLNTRSLDHALFKVEEVIHVYDFLAENKYLLHQPAELK